MVVLKIERDYGHYKIGDEVRLDNGKARLLIGGGYATKIGEAKEKKMAKAPENKSTPKKKATPVKDIFKRVTKRKKASNEE